ncbi:MAG: LysM peptidoglycan-binding domain-containing M23 family metallopeptidase [Candidatus Omnitrophica bacterium]|nr:LysM peptidoglycan-binding domain-containing M23 family metallopeptidase [Candidatus Omnitrophota bacterium]
MAPQAAGVPGVYHRIEKGETLFRISRTYNIDIDELARVNRISDASRIETGQLIFIPNRQKTAPLSQPQANDDFIWPVRGRVVLNFGLASNNMINRGINIQPYVNKEVVASRSGRVIFYSPHFYNYGRTLIIDHGDGFLSVYARNSEVFIKVGQTVKRGSVIARVGAAGRDKNEYLHFEIRKGYIPQNPNFYLP